MNESSAAQSQGETDACGCASGGRHACGLPGVASGPTLDRLSKPSAARGHFARRFRRLYRYFRGSPKMIGATYRHNPRSRRRALWLAWGYARKGGDAA